MSAYSRLVAAVAEIAAVVVAGAITVADALQQQNSAPRIEADIDQRPDVTGEPEHLPPDAQTPDAEAPASTR